MTNKTSHLDSEIIEKHEEKINLCEITYLDKRTHEKRYREVILDQKWLQMTSFLR